MSRAYSGTGPLREKDLPGYEEPLVGQLPDNADDLWPRGRVPAAHVPLELRCHLTGRVHQLRVVTFVGRSRARLRKCDLILDKPDISRVHSRIEVRPTAAGLAAFVVDYDETATREADSPRSMSLPPGTTVDGQSVPPNERGLEMYVGSLLRFGDEELWEVCKTPLPPSKPAPEKDIALGDRRRIVVLTAATYEAVRSCTTWGELSLVLLETLREVEVMTADVNKGITYRLDAGIDLIEVYDDALPGLDNPVTMRQHLVVEVECLDATSEKQVRLIKEDLSQGCTLRCRLVDGDSSMVNANPSSLHDGRTPLSEMINETQDDHH